MAYQNYSQTDPRWAKQRLGTVNGINLGMAGCYVTAFANVAEHFGKNVTPGQLDDIFTDRRMYVQGNLCTDDMLTRIYSDIKFTGVYHCENVPCDLSVFNEFNNYEHEAIVELDASAAPGVQTHFCRFFDYNVSSGVVRIVDSQDGRIISIASRYGDPKAVILKVVKYVGPSAFRPAPTVMPEITPAPPVENITPPSSAPPSIPPSVPVEAPQAPVVVPPPVSPPDTTTPVVTTPDGPRLPDRDSATGRTLATLIQAGFATLTVAIVTFLLSPDAATTVADVAPWLLPALPVAVSIATLINNLNRPEVRNY